MARHPYYDSANGQIQNGGRKPSYDGYDSDEFYKIIETLAKNGAKDSEIAVALRETVGARISPKTFTEMKNGYYPNWTAEENERRSLRIREVLADAREDINRIVRSVYLMTALGKAKVKSTSKVTRRLRMGGELTENEEIQTTETESGVAPNMQAIAKWLYHHDPEWRNMQDGIIDDDMNVPTGDRVKKGIDINLWINKEMTEKSENANKDADVD